MENHNFGPVSVANGPILIIFEVLGSSEAVLSISGIVSCPDMFLDLPPE